MNDLLPFADYDDPAEWSTPRVTALMAVLWGVPLGLVLWFTGGRVLNLGAVLLVSLAAGSVFGLLWSRSFRWLMRRTAKRIYDADPTLVPAPPGGDFQFRVMGNLFRGRIAVGGHLYAAPERWMFVPHRKNLRQHQRVIEIAPARVEVVAAPPWVLTKLFTSRPAQLLRIDDPSGAFLLRVPRPSHIAISLRGLAAGHGSPRGTP